MIKALAILGIFGVAAATIYAIPASAETSTDSGENGVQPDVLPNWSTMPQPPPETPRDLWSKVINFSISVAQAEGFFVAGSVPQRFHNPGDLGPGDTGFPGEIHDGSNVSILPDDATGWTLLYKKITRMLSGQSSTFPPTMTFEKVAQTYAARWEPWLATMEKNLGVTSATTLAEYASM